MKFNNPEKDVNIVELMSMLHIPVVNEIFAKEFKKFNKTHRIGLMEIIENYEKEKSLYMETLFQCRLREARESGDALDPPLYWFELTRYGFDDWRMSHLLPTPPPETPHYQLLPQDLMTLMSESLVDPHKVNTEREAYSELLNKTVELHFVHYSSTYILGTLRAAQNRATPDTPYVTKELKAGDDLLGSMTSLPGFLADILNKSLNKPGSPTYFLEGKAEVVMDTPNGKVTRVLEHVKNNELMEQMQQMAGVPGGEVLIAEPGSPIEVRKVNETGEPETEKRDTEMSFRTFYHYLQQHPVQTKEMVREFMVDKLPELQEKMAENGDEYYRKQNQMSEERQKIALIKELIPNIEQFSDQIFGIKTPESTKPGSEGEGGVNLYDLINYVHVPEVNKIFTLTLEQFNSEDHMDQTGPYLLHKVLVQDELSRKIAEGGYPPVYRFEMSPYSQSDW
ncbi:MAG: hypothetical protein GY940_38435, partial [bacterium]|nr:hypothetical protein [bacterium]